MTTAVAEKPVRAAEPLGAPTQPQYQYPGIPTTCDGAEAVVHVEVHVAQAAGAYPITSSTTMGGGFNASVMNGQKNLWGDSLMFFEPESEHSAASVCEGFAAAGERARDRGSVQLFGGRIGGGRMLYGHECSAYDLRPDHRQRCW